MVNIFCPYQHTGWPHSRVQKMVVVIRVKDTASWEGFDVVMAELDLGKKIQGLISSPLSSSRPKENITLSSVTRNKKSAKLTSTFSFEGVHRK